MAHLFSNWYESLSLEPATYCPKLSLGCYPSMEGICRLWHLHQHSLCGLSCSDWTVLWCWMTNCTCICNTKQIYTSQPLTAAGSGPGFCHLVPGLPQLATGHSTSAAHLECSSLSGKWPRPFQHPRHSQTVHPSPPTMLCQAAGRILTAKRAQLPLNKIWILCCPTMAPH